MSIRSALKNFFLTGNKPTQAQYHDLIDSLAHKTEDQDKMGGGLKPHSSVRPYKAGEAILVDNKIRTSNIDQTGSYNAANWTDLTSDVAVLGLAPYDPTEEMTVGDQRTHRNAIYEAIEESTGIEPGVDEEWETYWEAIVYTEGGVVPVLPSGGFVKYNRIYSYRGTAAAKGFYRCVRSDVGFDGGFKTTNFATELGNGDWRLEAICPEVIPKKYVALLTQAGGADPQTATSGSLVVGVTYEITDYNTGDDFTNVGAPSNALGVKFVATGTTPAVWTNSSELSYDNGAPTTVVLENTIGNIWWERLSGQNGKYYANSNGLFTVGKTGFFIGPLSIDSTECFASTSNTGDPNLIYLQTTTTLAASADEGLNSTMIEIRVYE